MVYSTNNTKQAFWIALATFFSMCFGIISAIILSRYFSKSDYGTYKQVLYVYSIILLIFTLGIPKAYSFFLPRYCFHQSRDIIRKITTILLLLGFILSLILFLLSKKISILLNNPDLELALKIFSPVPLFILPTLGIENIFSTFRKTHFSTIYTFITRVFMLFCVLLPVVVFKKNYIYAIIGITISSFLNFLVALYLQYFSVKQYKNYKTDLNYRQILAYALPSMLASIWGAIEISTNQFFISRYFGIEEFADYSNGAMEIPLVGMILGATAAVLSPIFSRMSHEKIDIKNELYPLWIRVFEKSVMLTYPVLIFSIVFAEDLMTLLYGHSYENSATYFQIFNLYLFFQIIVCGPYLINTGHQKLYANVHMYSVFILIPLQLMSLSYLNNPFILVFLFVLIKITRTLFFLNIISRDLRMEFRKLIPIKLLLKVLGLSVFICLFLKFLAKLLVLNSLVTIFMSLVLYFLIYFFAAIIFNINYFSILYPMVKWSLKK